MESVTLYITGTKVVCQSHERFTAGVIEVASQEPTNQGANVHQITMKKGSLEKNPADQCRESPTGNLTLSKDNSESESCSGGPIQAQKGTLSLTKGVSGNLTQLSPSDHNKSKPVEHSNSHDQPKVQVPKETCGVLPPDIPTAMQPIMRKDNSHPDARPLQGNQENKYSEVTTKQSDTKFNIKYKDDNQKEKEKPVASSESAIIPTSFGTKPTSSGMSGEHCRRSRLMSVLLRIPHACHKHIMFTHFQCKSRAVIEIESLALDNVGNPACSQFKCFEFINLCM